MEDQVRRRAGFEAAHPEWRIISPQNIRSILRQETEWRAEGPAGLIRDRELGGLLDQLDKLTGGSNGQS